MTIRKNLEALEQKIAEAAAKSGRRRRDVTLVAVSKTVGAAEVGGSIRRRPANFRREPRAKICWRSFPLWKHTVWNRPTGI